MVGLSSVVWLSLSVVLCQLCLWTYSWSSWSFILLFCLISNGSFIFSILFACLVLSLDTKFKLIYEDYNFNVIPYQCFIVKWLLKSISSSKWFTYNSWDKWLVSCLYMNYTLAPYSDCYFSKKSILTKKNKIAQYWYFLKKKNKMYYIKNKGYSCQYTKYIYNSHDIHTKFSTRIDIKVNSVWDSTTTHSRKTTF